MAAVRIACLVTSCALVREVLTSDNDWHKLETIPSRAWTSAGTGWASGGKRSLMRGLSQTVCMTARLCIRDRLCLPKLLSTQAKISPTSRRTNLRFTPSSPARSAAGREPLAVHAPRFAASLLLRRDSRCRSLARSRCRSLAASSTSPALCSPRSALHAGPSRRMPALLSRALTLPICSQSCSHQRRGSANR